MHISSGTVTLTSCDIYSNTATYVCAARRHQTHHHAHPIAPLGCSLFTDVPCLPLLAEWRWRPHSRWDCQHRIIQHLLQLSYSTHAVS